MPPIVIAQKVPSLFPIVGSSSQRAVAKGLIDQTGRVIAPIQYEDAKRSSEGFAAVRVGEKWGFVDLSGTWAVPARWLAVSAFSEGLAAVVEEKMQAGESMEDRVEIYKCGYVDKTGAIKIKPAWVHDCGPFHEGRAPSVPTYEGGLLRVLILNRSISDAGPPPLEGYVDDKGRYVFLSAGVKEKLGEAWVNTHHAGADQNQ